MKKPTSATDYLPDEEKTFIETPGEAAWKAYWVAQGKWLDHRLESHGGDPNPGRCEHKEQKDVDAAAEAYLAARRLNK